MRPELLLLEEMIDAGEQAYRLTSGVSVTDLSADRQRRDALLWNFTVLGEAAGRIPEELKGALPGHSLETAFATEESDRAWLLVGGSGSSGDDGAGAAA